MASYEFDPSKSKARLFFRHGGKQFNKTIRLASDREAARAAALIEETLQDLERGKLAIPGGADPAAFIMSGGRVAAAAKAEPVSHPCHADAPNPTIGGIFDVYAETLTPGSKEANTVYTEALHGRHFKRILGADRRFDALSVDVLQGYVNKRAGKAIARDTIHKELTTLRVVWGWAFKRKLIACPLSWRIDDLTLPKSHESPPFQTWEQITRKIERGGLTEAERTMLFEGLWLNQAETTECLAWVREHATRPFLHPLIAFAAFTGARRSEMVRSERDDWDFGSNVVTIRQKKSDKSKSFTRRSVPIHPALSQVMREWFEKYPGGRWTIAKEEGKPLDPRIATGYFRRLMRGGKWSVLSGFHTFRHSLASNMASAGVDGRVISEILGHRTEEMERHYRHLLPRTQAHALNALFGTPAPGG